MIDSAMAKSAEASGRGAAIEAQTRYRRAPAVPVAAAFASGILADHLFEADLAVWLIALGAALSGWAICFLRRAAAASALALLAAVLIAGALWHHWRWSIVGTDHITRFAHETPQPVRLTGRLLDQPWIVPRKEPELPASMARIRRVASRPSMPGMCRSMSTRS